MGEASPRITAADFLTPPEFAGLTLARRSAGQIGGVRLELVHTPVADASGLAGTVADASGSATGSPRTKLARCYQQVPVRVLPPFHFDGEPAGLLYLLNPTAGLMDGDGHLIEITAGPGTCSLVTGQSANRVHPAVAGFATQQWRLRLEEDSTLVILPGPTIPFAGCRYYQRAAIGLAQTARLIWGDVWLPGRYARAERSEWFQFDRLIQDMTARRDGELVYRERFCWRGPWDDESGRWHLGGPRAAGSVFVTGRVAPEWIEAEPGCDQAILTTEAGDTCLRWCGSPAAVVRAVVVASLTLAGRWLGGEWAPWFLGGRHLAPNHWFHV
jgi:urease accessory protein